MLVGEKRKRLAPEQTQAFIDDLVRLPVDVDIPSSSTVFNLVQALCRKHGLTPYDALEIAMREKNGLATVDQDLRRAATAEGVELI